MKKGDEERQGKEERRRTVEDSKRKEEEMVQKEGGLEGDRMISERVGRGREGKKQKRRMK